jgi:hypothetical protein
MLAPETLRPTSATAVDTLERACGGGGRTPGGKRHVGQRAASGSRGGAGRVGWLWVRMAQIPAEFFRSLR